MTTPFEASPANESKEIKLKNRALARSRPAKDFVRIIVRTPLSVIIKKGNQTYCA
jgi:hypothetical protein